MYNNHLLYNQFKTNAALFYLEKVVYEHLFLSLPFFYSLPSNAFSLRWWQCDCESTIIYLHLPLFIPIYLFNCFLLPVLLKTFHDNPYVCTNPSRFLEIKRGNQTHCVSFIEETSAPIGAWKCNFHFWKLWRTDQPTNQSIYQRTHMRVCRRVTLTKTAKERPVGAGICGGTKRKGRRTRGSLIWRKRPFIEILREK